jgi:ADP-ribose pyrophosphatase
MPKSKKPWTTLSSKEAYKNPRYRIIHDKFILPNGKIGDYFFIDKKYSAFVIPVLDGKIIMEKQYRYPIRKWSVELPGGDTKDGHSTLETAKEELREELGYTAKFRKIGNFVPYNGVSREICTAYLATDLKFVGKDLEETEVIKEIEIPIKEVFAMLDNGKITDGMTIAALTLARKYLIK